MIILYIIGFILGFVGTVIFISVTDSRDITNKNTLRFREGLTIFILLISGNLIGLSIGLSKSSKTSPISDSELVETVQEELIFEDSVYNYILELNIKHPDIVFRQARIESGNFKSKVFKDNNNMFGFKKAYKRPNTQIGTNRGYATYNSWQECVVDYALYQTYSAKGLDEDAYKEFLGRNYAEDPEYINKISKVK